MSDLLENELRASRPQPSDELVSRIEGRIRSDRPARTRRGSFRIAVPVALTAALVGALAAVGGVGFAATSVTHAVSAVAHVFSPAKVHGSLTVEGATAGGDQYRPGFGFGDPNHNHEGPPGLQKKGGEFAPPLTARVVGKTATVSTSFTVDEQAHLFISVLDHKTGKQLVITQDKSKVAKPITGNQAKTVNYLVLVPRTISLKLAVPARLLLPGHNYVIRVIALDAQGNKSTLQVPFTG